VDCREDVVRSLYIDRQLMGKIKTMETANARKVNPILAFLAGFFGLGLGYLYVGKPRFAIATIAGIYAVLAFFAWTRLVVYSATVWWLLWVVCLLALGISLIHPVVLAAKHRVLPRRKYNRWWVYLLWILGFNSVGVSLSSHRAAVLGYEPFRIPSTSMSPTVELGDFVLADTWRYRGHAAVAGEIVIVERPENPGVKYIKRLVAVAGDTIEMREGIVYRNGRPVAEPYLHAPVPYGGSPRNVPASTLTPGLIYVLGDYRDNSLDSRQWGPLAISSLRGRVQYIWLSIEGHKIRWNRISAHLYP
jgi:signal peptidase I